MPRLLGELRDATTGEVIEGRVQVITSQGEFAHPDGALLKVGTGEPFFYADGRFEVEVPGGKTRLLVERGTEYRPFVLETDVGVGDAKTIEVSLERWSKLGEQGWHPGNTHLHYDEKEGRPDERLRLDPRVENLRMTAVSILKRRDLQYASNKYSPGVLTEFSTDHHHVQCGEETRHNAEDPWSIGYGHVMLLNLETFVKPVSRGILVDAFDPDYPPLSYACDDARTQGGLVIWCHNGQGMEAPVAAVLGKVDAFNLFDPYWMDPEYDIYYRMLNAGIRLPASTGTDWFVCSANRVYAYTGGEFDYGDWLGALRAGRTFITNGPALWLDVNGQAPGGDVQTTAGVKLPTTVRWESHYPVQSAELIVNGRVLESRSFPEGSRAGHFDADISVAGDSWVAARLGSATRDSFAQPLFAHTSPVYVTAGAPNPESAAAAGQLAESIGKSIQWVMTRGRFYSDAQRREVADLFRQGEEAYLAIVKGSESLPGRLR